MIKIIISSKKKKKILELIYKDAKKEKTGLINVLNNKNNKSWLKRYFRDIYDLLYTNGDVDEEEVKKLLWADRNTMEQYIRQLGKYNKKKSDKLLKRIFRYKNFSNRDVAYKILAQMNIKVCPYCNRQYIVTLKNKKVRPQFDHFFPKSEYPYLALSVFNLVPCCSVCNMAKSALDTYTEPILYPFSEEFGFDILFTTVKWKNVSLSQYTRGLTDKFDVDIVNPNGMLVAKVDKQIQKLHLKDLYNEHKDYIQEIFKHHYIYTDKRLKELCNTFPELFKSIDDTRNFVYMIEIEKENWGKRSLAKLTSDIIRELDSES